MCWSAGDAEKHGDVASRTRRCFARRKQADGSDRAREIIVPKLRRVDMRSTQRCSITLPNAMADALRAKVAAGEYATESEVIRDGCRALQARDRAIEDWLRSDMVARYDALRAEPSRAVSVGRVEALLAAVHKKATAKP